MIPQQFGAVAERVRATLAAKPECFITHPAELHVLHQLTDDELIDFAERNGWRVVRRVGSRQIEFYNDVTTRPRESGRG